MKKAFLTLSIIALASVSVLAQGKKLKKDKEVATPTATAEPAATTIKFEKETHDFGNIQQGDPAEVVFSFTNTGKEPLIVQNVNSSCGCTIPEWSKDPVAPGQTGIVKAKYNSNRIGGINRAITVKSNAGTTTLHLKGNVDKAPESSVPSNTSMIKTNQ